MKIQYKSNGIHVFESAIYRTTTTVIETAHHILLVDPNTLPIEISAISRHVQSIRVSKKLIIIFTHSDFDHIIGYKAFEPDLVIASDTFAKNQNKEQILRQINAFDDRFYIKRDYEVAYPKVDSPITRDGQMFSQESLNLEFYLSPGHNPDGIIVYERDKGILIVGDYLSNIEFPFVEFGIECYQETIEKISELIRSKNIKMLIPGHGDATTDHQEMLTRINDALAYLSELKAYAKGKEIFDSSLLKQYPFQIDMEKYHQNNLKLARSER